VRLAGPRLRQGDYRGPLLDLQREQQQIKRLADTGYYLGVVCQKQKNRLLARQHDARAQTLFQQGYYRRNDYCESLDKVYLADIQAALATVQ